MYIDVAEGSWRQIMLMTSHFLLRTDLNSSPTSLQPNGFYHPKICDYGIIENPKLLLYPFLLVFLQRNLFATKLQDKEPFPN